jgi:hypothetical protein
MTIRAIPFAALSLCLSSCATPSPTPDVSAHNPPGQGNAEPQPAPQATTLPTGETVCGGVARLPCPQGKECADNPEDSCDPEKGGRDCSGVCIDRTDEPPTTAATAPTPGTTTPTPSAPKGCTSPDPKKKYMGNSPDQCARMRFVCEPGMNYFSDDCGCGCQKS